ncbi:MULTISPECIES: TspO/MBR family protein [Rhizobium/Agrobacterium group]|uniref:TspO/MBR family protein n=1 Tax=Rhizobium/Agrobacterium group TaxID=227290 RepID=UPI0012E883E5|nr:MULTISPECIES: TspO/MBR family protein [Rhizobium/Agrobacterium group]MCF1474277.1 tryptophan-rich sensory protein [Allorhizobium ampelinum]MVA51573.1 tryptophan-rich sensory protein [Agrobacterium vitis]NSZ51534.1 tryptophan-rich sensory protein [Agrobacterium vitis]NTA30293.1 tryptophan-rich sensory protein [Agrobacterium vitis]
MRNALTNLIFMAAVTGIGTLIGLTNLPGDWYDGLEKPFFNPPGWIFGPVWTVLYVLIGLAGARIWQRTRQSRGASRAMALWFGQMLLNFLWSPAFFGAHSTGLALIVILPMLALILAFVWQVRRLDRVAMLCFIPYAAWVAFATVLNAALFLLN